MSNALKDSLIAWRAGQVSAYNVQACLPQPRLASICEHTKSRGLILTDLFIGCQKNCGMNGLHMAKISSRMSMIIIH